VRLYRRPIGLPLSCTSWTSAQKEDPVKKLNIYFWFIWNQIECGGNRAKHDSKILRVRHQVNITYSVVLRVVASGSCCDWMSA
jgi:hypothetical protein